MAQMRVADYIVLRLESLGVDALFLLAGGGMMHLLDAVGRSAKINVVCEHHEQCCGFAADAYARVSGRVGACFATSGPGGLNTLTSVVSAWQDSTPVLFFTGQAKLSHTIFHSKIEGLRQFGTFEADIVPMVKSSTKYAAVVESPERIRFHMDKAIFEAQSGRPGPCLLDVPLDVQGALIDPDALEGFLPPPPQPQKVPTADLKEILKRLEGSRRPLIVAGHGIRSAGAADEFRALIEKLQIPVVTNGMAVDLIPYHHPLLVGHPGVKGDRAGNLAMQNADLLLCLGTSLHAMTTGYEIDQFSPSSYKIHVDPDPAVHARQEVKINKKIHLDTKVFIDAIWGLANPLQISAQDHWRSRVQFFKESFPVSSEPHKKDGDQVNYYEVIEAINSLSLEGDIMVTDAGLPFYLMGQAFLPKKNQRVILCGALGQMGYALPATTGACFAAPDQRVLCITGDGSLQTNIHELSVIQYHQLNAKIIVVNNGGYVSIRNTQNNYFQGFLVGTDEKSGVPIPDLSLICQASSLNYFSSQRRETLMSTFQQALATPGPAVLEIFARHDQEVIPSVSSERLASGKMISKPLQDMYPFMDATKLKTLMENI